MPDKPSDEIRTPPDPMPAALAAWNAMVDLVAATQAAVENTAEPPAPRELERWLSTLEAIVECLQTIVSHTRAPGISGDDLIAAGRNLRSARDAWAALRTHRQWVEEQAHPLDHPRGES